MKKILLYLLVVFFFIKTNIVFAEYGAESNTLFLYHFDGNASQADYSKALNGPLPVLAEPITMSTDTEKFGSASYPLDGSSRTLFSIYTNGTWVLNPHECTIDYWFYTTSDWDATYRSLGPGFYTTSPTRDFRMQHTPSQQFQPYLLGGSNSFSHTVPYSTFTANAPKGQWNHIAWTWSSRANNSYVFLNGVAVSSTFSNVSTTTYGLTDPQWQAVTSWGVHGMQGFAYAAEPGTRMDELRISDIDRYQGQNFTPPTSAYTTGGASACTQYAVSTPIMNKYAGNPILTPGPAAWENAGVLHISVIKDSVGYKMYYTGEYDTTLEYSYRAIGVATSADGINWIKYAGNPVIVPSKNISDGEFDDVHCHMPTVIWDTTKSPAYKMWYSGYQNNIGNTIGYAYSNDGFTWTKYSGNPVLGYGTSGTFDDNGLRKPEVIWDSSVNLYKMWYNGTTTNQHYGPTGYATSTDGINWVKYGQITQDETRLEYGDVVKDTTGLYRMWWNNGSSIAYSISPDGINWCDYDLNNVINPGSSYDSEYDQPGTAIYDPSSNNYLYWFNGAALPDETLTIEFATVSKTVMDSLFNQYSTYISEWYLFY